MNNNTAYFKGDLKLKQLSENKWAVDAPFSFHFVKKGIQYEITVPKGEKTDLASVPKMFQWFVPKSGIHNRAAIVHDKICRDVVYGRTFYFYDSHWERSVIFLRALKACNVPFVKRWIMFLVVFAAGSKMTTGDTFYGK